jgi:tripartite-type tricarboxylate transporter receptor subunit TctC
MLRRRDALAATAAALIYAGCNPSQSASAQALKKPVRIVVGFPAGGGADVTARILADGLRGTYAATVVVENKPGAGSRLAAEHVKNADPDGSVMLFTPDFPMTLYPHSFRSLNYDPVRDFVAVAPTTKSMLGYNVGRAVPETVKTLPAYVEWCKANPGNAMYATTSAGATPHFTGMMLAREAGIGLAPVHYRGGAPALQDLLGGHVTARVNPISEILSLAKSGELRILAVTGSRRSPFLPDVPTMREWGYNVVVESWLGVFMPARVPDEIVNALSAAIAEATKSAQMTENLAKFGSEPAFETPAQFAMIMKAELERWAPVVKASGFVAEE